VSPTEARNNSRRHKRRSSPRRKTSYSNVSPPLVWDSTLGRVHPTARRRRFELPSTTLGSPSGPTRAIGPPESRRRVGPTSGSTRTRTPSRPS
jgi:hypothetical protein